MLEMDEKTDSCESYFPAALSWEYKKDSQNLLLLKLETFFIFSPHLTNC